MKRENTASELVQLKPRQRAGMPAHSRRRRDRTLGTPRASAWRRERHSNKTRHRAARLSRACDARRAS
eukprot:6209077-Pleurochrysis_carterae.AAC.1